MATDRRLTSALLSVPQALDLRFMLYRKRYYIHVYCPLCLLPGPAYVAVTSLYLRSDVLLVRWRA